MSSIARSVREIKGDLGSIIGPGLIGRLCQAAGHVWRDRTLGPVETIYLFIGQVLHGNTSCAHVRQLGDFAFTRSAYCEARKRLPVEVFRELLRATGQRVTEEASRVGLWRGHRVVSVDGSSFSMSDTTWAGSLGEASTTAASSESPAPLSGAMCRHPVHRFWCTVGPRLRLSELGSPSVRVLYRPFDAKP